MMHEPREEYCPFIVESKPVSGDIIGPMCLRTETENLACACNCWRQASPYRNQGAKRRMQTLRLQEHVAIMAARLRTTREESRMIAASAKHDR